MTRPDEFRLMIRENLEAVEQLHVDRAKLVRGIQRIDAEIARRHKENEAFQHAIEMGESRPPGEYIIG